VNPAGAGCEIVAVAVPSWEKCGMPGVFISYRREDSSGYAGRLFDILSAHFGKQNTFMDFDSIQGGDDFSAVIEAKISVSDVLVAVIGSHWLTITAEDGTRRLDSPCDFVRLEIGKALERGIRVIPVLVGGAGMPPAEDLPDDLRALCERQAVEVRDAHFHADAAQLIDVLHKALHGVGFNPANFSGRQLSAVLSGIAVVLVVLGLLFLRHPQSAPRASSAAATKESASKSIPGDGALNAKPHPADVTGKWKATVKYDWGDTYSEVFDFEVDGKDVSGTASFLGSGGARAIFDGKVEGKRLSFSTKSFATSGSDEKTYEDKHYYQGTVENDTIRFTMTTDSSMESHVPIHFIASKVNAQ
jgi:hypothetical protein